MPISQPTATSSMSNPSHSLLHRIIAADLTAPVESMTVDASGLSNLKVTDSATNSVSDVLKITHETSGTPSSGFGAGILFELQAAAGGVADAARIEPRWTGSVDADPIGVLRLSAANGSGVVYPVMDVAIAKSYLFSPMDMLGNLSIEDATPKVSLLDNDAMSPPDAIVNMYAEATGLDAGLEDVDFTISQAIGGSETIFLHSDADGDIEIGDGARAVALNGNVKIGSGAAGVDYALTFNGQSNDGVITWMEDEDYFSLADDLLLSNKKLYLTNTGHYLYETGGHLSLVTSGSAYVKSSTVILGNGTLADVYVSGADPKLILQGQWDGPNDVAKLIATEIDVDNIDLTLNQLVGGSLVNVIFSDADGEIEIGNGDRDVHLKCGKVSVTGADSSTLTWRLISPSGANSPYIDFQANVPVGYNTSNLTVVGIDAGGSENIIDVAFQNNLMTLGWGDDVAINGSLRLGNAYVAGAPTATGYLIVKDSNGTEYKIPAVAA